MTSPTNLFLALAEAPIMSPKVPLNVVKKFLACSKSPIINSQVSAHPD